MNLQQDAAKIREAQIASLVAKFQEIADGASDSPGIAGLLERANRQFGLDYSDDVLEAAYERIIQAESGPWGIL